MISGLPMGLPIRPLSDLTSTQKKIVKRHLNSPASRQRYIDMIDTYKETDKKFNPVSLSLLGIIGFIAISEIRKRS